MSHPVDEQRPAEVVGSSTTGLEDALRRALGAAGATVRQIRAGWVDECPADGTRDDVEYHVNLLLDVDQPSG